MKAFKFVLMYFVGVLVIGTALFLATRNQKSTDFEPPPLEVVAPEPTNPPLMWDDGTPERIKWSEWLREEIGAHEWSPAIQMQCKTVGLKECIAQTIAAIAFYESSFNPRAVKLEEFNDNTKDYVVSRGLFQLSKGPANQKAYGCGLESSYDLNDPLISISCMVKIANYWLNRDLKFWGVNPTGFGRYHAVAQIKHKNFNKLISYVDKF